MLIKTAEAFDVKDITETNRCAVDRKHNLWRCNGKNKHVFCAQDKQEAKRKLDYLFPFNHT